MRNMILKKKKIRINSIILNKDFLFDLGEIIEAQIKSTEEELEKKIKNLIDSSNQSEQSIEHIRYMNRPDYIISYAIQSEDTFMPFSSMEKMLSTKTFPEKILKIDFRVSSNNLDKVDINFSINNKSINENVILSSSNEKELLFIEGKLKELFDKYKTNYSWFISRYYGWQIFFISLLFSFIFSVFFLKNLFLIFPSLMYDNTKFFIICYPILLIFAFVSQKIIKSLLPLYIIDLNKNTQKRRKSCIGAIIFLLSAIIIPYAPNIYSKINQNYTFSIKYDNKLILGSINPLDSERSIWEMPDNIFGFVSINSINEIIDNPYKNTFPMYKKNDSTNFEIQKNKNELFLIANVNKKDLELIKNNNNKKRIKITICPLLNGEFSDFVAIPIRSVDYIKQRKVMFGNKDFDVIDIETRMAFIDNIVKHN